MVKIGKSGECVIVGIGSIRQRSNIRDALLLNDVRYIPDVRMNFIFRGVLHGKRYASSITKGYWKLSKGSLVVSKVDKCCSLYKTYGVYSDTCVSFLGA